MSPGGKHYEYGNGIAAASSGIEHMDGVAYRRLKRLGCPHARSGGRTIEQNLPDFPVLSQHYTFDKQ